MPKCESKLTQKGELFEQNSTCKIVSEMRPRWYELEMELGCVSKVSSISATRISDEREGRIYNLDANHRRYRSQTFMREC